MTRGVVFDMDDTLYLERDYVRSGFACVAREVGRNDEEASLVERWLLEAFQSGIRGNTFDLLLATFPALMERTTVADLVAAYRAHKPAITLCTGVAEVLDALKRGGLRIGVLSDGPLVSQTAKAAALGLRQWFDPVVLTDALGAHFVKPSTAGFEAIGDAWGLPAGELAYVADNPGKDFAGPRLLGWRTIRLRHGGQLRAKMEPRVDADRADVEIREFAEVPDALR